MALRKVLEAHGMELLLTDLFASVPVLLSKGFFRVCLLKLYL